MPKIFKSTTKAKKLALVDDRYGLRDFVVRLVCNVLQEHTGLPKDKCQLVAGVIAGSVIRWFHDEVPSP